MPVIRSDVFKKLLQCERLFADWSNDEISFLKREIHTRAIPDLRLFGVCLWDAESEAIAPFLNGGHHEYTMAIQLGGVKSLSGDVAEFV